MRDILLPISVLLGACVRKERTSPVLQTVASSVPGLRRRFSQKDFTCWNSDDQQQEFLGENLQIYDEGCVLGVGSCSSSLCSVTSD